MVLLATVHAALTQQQQQQQQQQASFHHRQPGVKALSIRLGAADSSEFRSDDRFSPYLDALECAHSSFLDALRSCPQWRTATSHLGCPFLFHSHRCSSLHTMPRSKTGSLLPLHRRRLGGTCLAFSNIPHSRTRPSPAMLRIKAICPSFLLLVSDRCVCAALCCMCTD